MASAKQQEICIELATSLGLGWGCSGSPAAQRLHGQASPVAHPGGSTLGSNAWRRSEPSAASVVKRDLAIVVCTGALQR